MNLIMKDQARRTRMIDTKKEVELILIKMLTAFFIFAAVATVFTIISLKEAHGSVTSAVTDNLLSEDMAEYISKHPGTYTEEDLQ